MFPPRRVAGGVGKVGKKDEGLEFYLPVVLEREEVAGKGFAGVRWISGEEGAWRWRVSGGSERRGVGPRASPKRGGASGMVDWGNGWLG